jgi:hypothetical protein
MNTRLRWTAFGLVCAAFGLSLILQFLPFATLAGDRLASGTTGGDAFFWIYHNHSWFDPAFGDHPGVWLTRFAGPLLVIGLCLCVGTGNMLLSERIKPAAFVGLGAGLSFTLAVLLMMLGVYNWASPYDATPHVAFYLALVCALLAMAAGVIALTFISNIERDEILLPPRPILSVTNPNAFDPLENQDPRPFKPVERDYKSFEVTAGPKTFRPKTLEEQWLEETQTDDHWNEEDASPPPAKPPAQKPAAPAAAKPTAKPPAKAPANPAPRSTPAPAAPGDDATSAWSQLERPPPAPQKKVEKPAPKVPAKPAKK